MEDHPEAEMLTSASEGESPLVPGALSCRGKLNWRCCEGDLNTILPLRMMKNPESPRLAARRVEPCNMTMHAVLDPCSEHCRFARDEAKYTNLSRIAAPQESGMENLSYTHVFLKIRCSATGHADRFAR